MNIYSNFYELSQPQKSIWYLEQKYPNTCMNVVAGTLRFKGEIDYALLTRAVQLLIRNNETLRIHIKEEDGEALQFLTPDHPRDLEFVDFSQGKGFEDLFAWDEVQTQIPFSIIDSDLFYIAILKIDEENGGFYVKLHHLISDAWTMSVVGNTVIEYYTMLKNDPSFEGSMKPSFFEHLDNEKVYEASSRFERDKEYWNNKFVEYPEPTLLKPSALSTNSIKSARKTFVTPQKLSNKIRSYCAENRASVFTLFLSALSIYINRVTGNEDIIMGTTILNRVNAKEKDTIGMFVSVAAPIRIKINDSQNFSEFSSDMLKESMSILKHQKYPYNYLIRDLKKIHTINSRLFDIVLNYQNTKFANRKSDIQSITRWHFSGHQVESLVINVNDRDDEGKFIIDYDFLTDVYNVKEIDYIHQHVISLLWHALDNPVRPISQLEMLSEKEKRQILDEFNDTKSEYPSDKTLQDFLYEQSRKTPDNVAVIFGDTHMTYREVNERSNQLARVLKSKGVHADTVVGISLFRSFEMIVGIMGILKAGGAYLPMDPNYPIDRIKYMMNDSGAEILLTTELLSGRFSIGVDVISIDCEGICSGSIYNGSIYSGDSTNLPAASGPENLAYIIYTSGSTGNPKGVMVEHRGVVNRLHWGLKKYPIDESDCMMQKTPFTFDVSVWELFWWTFVGASVCMLEPDGEKDPEAILSTVEKNRITLIHFVPSMLAAFLSFVDMRDCAGRLSTVRIYFSSGEALTVTLTDSFNHLINRKFGSELINLYGPTEATVEVSYFDCSPKVTLKTVPIGKPIDNIHLYILDPHMNLLPIGIPGELYIGGVGVARGYINNPELTAEKFLPDPFFPGERIYRTGDRVRWFPKGDIEYMGRIDFQIKIRGFRIELGEIESRMQRHPAIKEAVVVGAVKNDNSYLCAYFTVRKQIDISELKEYLAKDMPDYMIPAFFVLLDKFPLSANGKVDRKALPSPDFSGYIESEYSPPETDTEKALTDICCQILRLEKVSVTESFFRMGGDSLYAIALITQIHKKFDIEMPVSEVFHLETIRKMSAYLSGAEKNTYEAIPKLEDRKSYEMSFSQKRLYVLNQLEDKDISYNLPGVMRISGSVDWNKLEKAFHLLILRHESLRTSFILDDGQPVQLIHKKVDFCIGKLTAPDSEFEEVIHCFIRPFDLRLAPLLRVAVLTLDSQNQFLLFDMHHIISDGSSINVLIRDLSSLYSSQDLPEMKTQYKDFAAWQSTMLSKKSMENSARYWLEQFSGEIPILNMPTDFPRPARKSYRGSKAVFMVNSQITAGLKKLSEDTGATVYMVMLSAYNILLSKYASQEDITVGIPVEGRLTADVNDLIGMFVNTVAIRSFPDARKSYTAFLQEVKSSLLLAYENQEYPFEELVDKLNVKRDMGRNPLFDTVFILQNMDISQISLGDATLTPYPFDSQTAKFDITLEAFLKGDTIELSAEYCTDLFEKSTIDRLLQHYTNILNSIVLNASQRIADIGMLADAEKQQLLVDFNRTESSFPQEKLIHQLFEEQVVRVPDRIALTFGSESLTYFELNVRANQLAAVLRQKGIGPDVIVGMCVPRSLDMIIGILGILKAGGAYLPMDPDYPVERNLYIMTDSNAALLLTQDELVSKWKDKVPVMSLQDPLLSEAATTNPPVVNKPGDLAYIIYTSGSTGNPKGVMIEHVNVVRLLFNDRFQFSFSERDVWTLFHSYCFDFSVWEMYGSLLYGGRLVILSKDAARDTEKFYEIVRNEGVTVLNQTPGAFYNFVLVDTASSYMDTSLRYVIFGGEALKPIMLKPFYKKHPSVRLVNMYGITETTVHVTFKEISIKEIQSNISNVGKAIPTLKAYILDKNLNLLPVGVPGELCVSGAGVGRGYINNESYTKQKFLKNPFIPGERLYRSGDLARLDINGDIEYLGRIDNQVKIRGYRIELGEIETALLKDIRIKETVVIAVKSAGDINKLYAYYVAAEKIDNDELRRELKIDLPDYMVPSIFVHLSKMPLNRNGKVDKSNLPQNEEEAVRIEFVEPSTDVQKTLSGIWSSVLDLTKVGMKDNFFDLGGDSLSAIKVTSKMKEAGLLITLVDLYNNPTIEQISEKIVDGEETDNSSMLVRLTPFSHKSTIDIICFPYGGGNAISYKYLGDALYKISQEYCLHGVNIPGHDIGGGDELLEVEEIAQRVFSEIKERIHGKIVLYGHCVGNAVLVETARLLEQAHMPIQLAVVGANFPPRNVKYYGNFFDPWMLMSDSGIIKYLSGLGLSKTALDNEYADFVIRAFRHDARAFYRYFFRISRRKGIRQKVEAKCICIVGGMDSITKGYSKRYHMWSAYFEDPRLFVINEGEHYFINSHAGELAEIIHSELIST